MSLAVATLCLGNEYEGVARLTSPYMQSYADSVRADFIYIDRAKGMGPTHHFEKYQLHELLNSYDRILYLDIDVLIVPNAPNLFPQVPQDCFGAYMASEHSSCHDSAVFQIQSALGQLNWTRHYFNSGVMLISKVHREVFDLRHGDFQSFYEQTQLNYNVRKLGMHLHDITFQFNHVQAAGGDRFSSYFIHYAGPGHSMGPKVEQIARDIDVLNDRIL